MNEQTIRTTISLPADLLAEVDRAVDEGRAKSRNDLVASALRRELAAQQRAMIDAAFEGMGDDELYRADSEALEKEFGASSWEAFRRAEADD
jgi:Arc/MetJ-type ribon-helix-helix transcriptional regulator